MNQTSLSTKLALAILAAILIPLAVMTYTSFVSVNAVSRDNLEAYVGENGTRRQEAIENDLRTALTLASNFTTANETALSDPLLARGRGIVAVDPAAAERRVRDLFRNELIGSGYFESVRLLSTDFRVFGAVALPGRSGLIALSPQEREGLERVAVDLSTADTQALAVISRSGSPTVDLVNAVFVPENEQRVIIGYMVTSINLETVFVDNLTSETGSYETYAYVILPGTNDIVAADDVLPLVDVTSLGAERAINSRATTVDDYEVGLADDRRAVVGYSSSLLVEGLNFGLVSEVRETAIQDQIFQRGASFIFPYVIGTVTLVIVVVVFLTNQMVVPPVNRLRRAVLGVMRGNYNEPVPDANRADEIGTLATSLVDMREYVRGLTDDMNRRLRERTRDVEVTQQISRAVTAERDLDRLMNRVVALIIDNFPSIYHAQIFLIDEQREFAVLRASTGEAGRQLLGRGHKLAVGSISVIGQVTEQGRVVIARDTAESDVHRRNEFLQDTRAELAIPLQMGGDIIGALDVQSKQSNTFNPDQVTALQTLADQVTIAIENARLYAQSARLLADLERERAVETRSQWQQYLGEKRVNQLAMRAGTTTDHDFEALIAAAYKSKQSVVGDLTNRRTIPFVVPVLLRGEILGVVEYEVPQTEFSYETVMLAEELTARLAMSLENARLFQTSQQTIQRERMVNEISTRLTSQTEIEAILQMAIREVGQALRTPQVAIKLNMGDQNGANVANGSNGSNGTNGTHSGTDAPNQPETDQPDTSL